MQKIVIARAAGCMEELNRWTCCPPAHVDTFSRDNLPPADQWPEFLLDGFDYPDHGSTAAVELTDAMVEQGFGDHAALIGNGPQADLQGTVRLDQPPGPCRIG